MIITRQIKFRMMEISLEGMNWLCQTLFFLNRPTFFRISSLTNYLILMISWDLLREALVCHICNSVRIWRVWFGKKLVMNINIYFHFCSSPWFFFRLWCSSLLGSVLPGNRSEDIPVQWTAHDASVAHSLLHEWSKSIYLIMHSTKQFK